MPGPYGALSVRVNDGHTDRLVNRYLSGLKFTKVAPGGHQACSFTLNLPTGTFTDLGPQDRCWIYDARSGRTIFDGYLENPTPTTGPAGQSWDISAMGGMALASDETRGLIYVDKTTDGWNQVNYGAAAASSSAEQFTDDAPGHSGAVGMRCQFPGGTVVATNAVAAVDNRVLERVGMQVGGLHVTAGSGRNDAGYILEMYDFTSTTTVTAAMAMTGATFDFWCGTDISPTGALLLQLRRLGLTTNVADDTSWANFVDLSLLGRRVDRTGTLLTGSAGLGSTGTVLASQVAEDLLGRLLTMCDPGTAQIDATTFGIDQLAYTDGAKAADVLSGDSGLDLYEPDFLWEILETLDNGKHRFNYRAWPTTPRYVVSVKDGWRQTGGDVDLCNRILVSWTDMLGNPQVTPVTASGLGLVGLGLPVDDLGTRVKDADPVTLPDGHGSLANAQQVGAAVLRDKINPPLAGTVTVRRRILDLLTGNYVMPWELEPGYLCRVRELGQDLRVTQVDYDDPSVASALTLGTPVRTPEQRIARLARAA